MNHIRQLGILLAICAAGDALSHLIGGLLPGNVLGMLLMLAVLASGLLKPAAIEHTADFFLKNMAVFFLPVSLGILELYEQLHSQLPRILIVVVATTFITALATAGTVHLILQLQQRGRKEGQP